MISCSHDCIFELLLCARVRRCFLSFLVQRCIRESPEEVHLCPVMRKVYRGIAGRDAPLTRNAKGASGELRKRCTFGPRRERCIRESPEEVHLCPVMRKVYRGIAGRGSPLARNAKGVQECFYTHLLKCGLVTVNVPSFVTCSLGGSLLFSQLRDAKTRKVVCDDR